ncbi:hypothetical protein HUW51_23190 [Adhaeribacter swui]|uniref:Uncharacterized protein n=1 Tax=Adhaeribacter swui TaxID=2086471 RepID=A0A7G7GE86_9BACT|nr:hypothetical protein [Adhaeribacter swui]QNF35470.1 hypothetical protein HUW51_23190 [Adhaeribacter swui]
MKQREVTAIDNTTWTCVQAYAAVNSKAAEKANDLSESENGEVPVVCTPSGGAQTVRLQLPKNWLEAYSDEQLLQEIAANQGA